MNTNGVSIHTSALYGSRLNAKVLTEGSSVMVRIIADRGGGKYDGTVAGVRVTLSSNKVLKPGDSFLAVVSEKNGTVFITPKEAESTVSQNPIVTNLSSSNEVMSYLSSLHLPSDSVSLSLFQGLRQLGLPFSQSVFMRLYALAKKFPGKEKSASAIMEILLQKGIDASKEDILSLLEGLSFSSDSSDFSEFSASSLLSDFDDGTPLVSAADFRSFFESLLLSNEGGQEEGLLTLMNHLSAASKGEGSWILLPYEIVCLGSKCGGGVMRFFMDCQKEMRQMNVSLDFLNKNFLFSLFFANSKCTKVMMNTDVTEKERKELFEAIKKGLFAQNPDAELVFCQKEAIEDFAFGLEEIFVIGGDV